MPETAQLLRPEVLAKISRLDLRARLIVEGFLAGLHKSPFHGFSVEFAQHREYVPGDEIKHVDWKVLARSDRYYIKQYEEETNLRAHILVDASESMSYGSGAMTKFEYASCAAAALAYLLLQQQDSVGMGVFDTEFRTFLTASSNPSHLRNVLKTLEATEPRGRTDPGGIVDECARQVPRKGLIILISDLFGDEASLLRALRELRHRRHEIIVLHVLDAYELTFPFRGNTLFEGMEGYEPVVTEPAALRKSYVEAVDAFIDRMRTGCLGSAIDYTLLKTSDPLDAALAAYLARRARRS